MFLALHCSWGLSHTHSPEWFKRMLETFSLCWFNLFPILSISLSFNFLWQFPSYTIFFTFFLLLILWFFILSSAIHKICWSRKSIYILCVEALFYWSPSEVSAKSDQQFSDLLATSLLHLNDDQASQAYLLEQFSMTIFLFQVWLDQIFTKTIIRFFWSSSRVLELQKKRRADFYTR